MSAKLLAGLSLATYVGRDGMAKGEKKKQQEKEKPEKRSTSTTTATATAGKIV